ncbi:MAG: hypothetical protein QM708_03205 [Propioniciclava sp.]|uniref:hypothetical protein n=1 Tax=Propioniciclava sp. TaxID=2038686 RepID=UPI0039E5F3CA
MRPRTDVVALVSGLLACVLAVLGLWAAFGTVAWSSVAVAAPISLVAVGLIGLIASREKS